MTNDHQSETANVKTILTGSDHFLQNSLRSPRSATAFGGRP